MRTLSKSKKNPFAHDQVVKAAQTFAYADGVVHAGEQYRGGDPVVQANWTAFVDGGTLPREMPNMWDSVPPPPSHAPPVQVWSTSIPVHRQVRCMVDASVPVQWTPDSLGVKSGAPPPFLRSQLRSGQILDVLDEHVLRHPEWFRAQSFGRNTAATTALLAQHAQEPPAG